MNNQEIAAILEGTARLLELQQANPFRVRSYRRAATAVRNLEQPVSELYQRGGEPALRELEGVGERLSGALRDIVEAGRLALRDRLQAELSPVTLLARVPGVGEKLAARIHDELGINSLEELEQAAHNGRLSRIEGIGEKRGQGIRDSLAGMLSRSATQRARCRTQEHAPPPEPPVDMILELDEEYRRKAERDELRTIAPKRFNPSGEAWLPIMERHQDSWDFTLLFSNTQRAHELNKTHDWVVVYYATDHHQDQCTVTTAGRGPLKNRRVIPGREAECRRYYAQTSS